MRRQKTECYELVCCTLYSNFQIAGLHIPSIIIIRIRIEGRGKSVLAEVTIPSKVVETIFKTTVDKMVSLSHAKLNLGTSAAITIGGWNAHAANVVAAIFLATGQVSVLFSRPIKYLVKKQRMRLKW